MDFEHVLKKNIEKGIEMVCLSHLESKRDEHFFFFGSMKFFPICLKICMIFIKHIRQRKHCAMGVRIMTTKTGSHLQGAIF